MKNMESFVKENKGKLFRFWVIKKKFTPYEMDKKHVDESIYENTECSYGYIKDAYELPDGDVLLVIEIDMEGCSVVHTYIEYHKLSEISLALSNFDNDIEEEDDDYEQGEQI